MSWEGKEKRGEEDKKEGEMLRISGEEKRRE